LAISGAFDDEIAIAAVFGSFSLSVTIWTSPASSDVLAGPV